MNEQSTQAETEAPFVLQMNDIDIRFPGVHALKKCKLDLRRGEVLALVGENGAGKSTMMKILTGIYPDYEGEVIFNGKKVHFNNIREAQNTGISIVHQELNLMNQLTVAKNIFIGRESKGFFFDEKTLNEKAQKLIDDFKINVKPTDKIADLSVGKSQMVEIARAMSYENTEVLVLDEPTAALSLSETEDLFEKVRALKQRGISVIFISHRMGEIKQITDRVNVMRDGEYIGTLDSATCKTSDIIKMMVGRSITEKPKSKSNVSPDSPVVLEAEHLTSDIIHDVSFNLRKGEILGFAGLVGAGRTEVMRLLFGADPMQSGTIKLNGKEVQIHSTKAAVKNGIAYLSEDRKRYGLLVSRSVIHNAVLPSLDKFLKGKLFISSKKSKKSTEEYVSSLKIKTPSTQQLIKFLSGGNQQKVVIAKWLIRDADILIMDEPTRGIDVGAKDEIYQLMEKLVSKGKSIIMISSDLNEVLRMSDRVIVMCEGHKTGDIEISQASQEILMKYATTYRNGGENNE